MQQTSNTNQEKALDLLKTNYQNLHFACWECHKFYWTMTSIFLPITLTAFVLIAKDIQKSKGTFVKGDVRSERAQNPSWP